MKWKPATIDEVREIVERDLTTCDGEQLSAFRQYAIEPFYANIRRYGHAERVVVVARNHDDVIYWEDVEEGFNLSPLAPDGEILEHSCNQDELGIALNAWIKGRHRPNTI